MPDWTDDYYALSGQKPPPGLFEALWCLAKAIIGVIHVSKKKDEPEELTPEDIGQCPTTPEEEQLLDSALEHDAGSEQEPKHSKRQDKKAACDQEPESTKLNPIDDLIGAVHQPLHRPMVDIPAELRAPKKIWTPEEEKPKNLYAHVPLTPEKVAALQAGQTPADLPGLMQKPFSDADPKPFIFSNTGWQDDDEYNYFGKLVVYASPAQKGRALVGITELDEQTLYLWFDVHSGHAVNSTQKPVKMYLIKDYDDFNVFVVTPGSVLALPSDNLHLLMTSHKNKKIQDFEFLNQHMPIKDSD
jgi:hypothetical protein